MKKNLFTTTLLAWVLCLLLPARMTAQTEINGLWYEFNASAKTAAVVIYQDTKYEGDITIPQTVEYGGVTYSVTSIEGSAFEYCSGLTSITIPEGVTSIGGSAFYYCRGLTSITIPTGVTSIESSAFYNCSGLTSITIPEGVTIIGSDAFSGTPFYNNQPDGLVYLGNVAYKYKGTMPANTSISLKEGTVGISDAAFRDCSGLTSITIPEGVTSIGESVFRNCSGLTSITIPSSVTSIGRFAFLYCSGLTSVTIPASVASIGNYAFQYCSSLTSVTIPESVTSIGKGAFRNCSSLTSVTVKNPTPVTITDSYTFENRTNATLYVPAGSKAAYEAASYWKNFKEIVEMEPDVPAYPEIESFAVVLNGERQTLHGKLVAQDGEEYIVTDAGVYRVTGRRERLAGDVNGDGKITIADVTGLVNVILGHAEAESATIYDVERAEGVTGIPGNGDFIGWGGVDEDGSLDPNVKGEREWLVNGRQGEE